MKNSQIFNAEVVKLSYGLVHSIGSQTILTTVLVLLFSVSCSKDDTASDDNGEVEVVNKVDVELPADPGEVGLVINAREIFRKGHKATEAKVTFPDHSEFDQTLEIGPVTNMAILKIPNEDLTEDQKSAFKSGVVVQIIIYDENQGVLVEYTHDSQKVDDTNDPITIPSTGLEYNSPPVLLKEGISYYIQPEGISGNDGTGGGGEGFDTGDILKANTQVLYGFNIPSFDGEVHFTYRYYFTKLDDGSYYIQRGAQDEEGGVWYFTDEPINTSSTGVIDVTTDVNLALEFKLEQDEDGWVRIREVGTNNYLTVDEGTSDSADLRKALFLGESEGDRFRFISSDIEWDAEDRGTEFSQSIIPPAEIDFAYAAIIKNCSQGMLTEEVGNTKERTSTRTVQTTESLQFFAGATATVGMSTGVSAGASVPGVGDVSASVELSASLELTTNVTTSNENMVGNEDSETSTVSRIRTLEIPPFTGVEVFDAVRVVKGAKVPFTQVIRLRANYSNGDPLTGDEILTQMLGNFVTAVPIETGEIYVDVGLSGFVTINEMFETETGIEEITDACN